MLVAVELKMNYYLFDVVGCNCEFGWPCRYGFTNVTSDKFAIAEPWTWEALGNRRLQGHPRNVLLVTC
jgi:hypothetical protein